MSSLTNKDIQEVLSSVKDEGRDLTVSGISVNDEKVVFMIEVDPSRGQAMEILRQNAQTAVEAIAGGRQVMAVLTSEKKPPPPAKGAPPVQHKISSNPVAPEVKYIIAVASGKGGVGKSTVSNNLAAAFVAKGWKTGLLDADIYGSSQPRMTGHHEKPEVGDDDLIIPAKVHGMKVMSMGFFVEPEAPIVWRGPMVHSAIQQLLRDVAWGALDVLVIDLPPGTGDAQLSLAQHVPLAGAVIVSTPQDVALSEAKKGMAMFEKLDVPTLGLIENMSYYQCAHCDTREDIFGHGGVREEAKRCGAPFLGEIPLQMDIRIAADNGTPLVLVQPDHAVSKTYLKMAEVLAVALEKTRRAA